MANAPYGELFYTQKTITARNTNVGTNLNRTTLTKVPIVGNVDAGFDTDFYTADTGNNRIICKFNGRIQVKCDIFFEGDSQRASINLRVYVNGTPRNRRGGGGYGRNASGQDQSVSHILTSLTFP